MKVGPRIELVGIRPLDKPERPEVFIERSSFKIRPEETAECSQLQCWSLLWPFRFSIS